MKPTIDIQQAYATLRTLRWMAWIVFLGEIVAVSGCAWFLFHNREYLPGLLKTFGPALFFWQILPFLAARFASNKKQQVHSTGNGWQIGMYSEEQLRSLVRDATQGLPARMQNPRILIADRRGTAGWTWLSLLWPGREHRKTIWITEGSLFYLEPDEVKALILHEIAHHDPMNRYDIPGGWLFGDIALFAFLTVLGSRFFLGAEGVFAAFFIIRPVVMVIFARIVSNASQLIEHLCDVDASRKIGATTVVNLLLKIGEEEELTEIVLARAARELLHVPDIAMDDLVFSFEKVRPQGRIFHDNLFRNATAVVKRVAEELKLKPETLHNKEKINEELSAYLEQRAGKRHKRIRWRELDSDRDSRLSQTEVASLCTRLRDNPDSVLFVTESEIAPSTHPAFRDRILLLVE